MHPSHCLWGCALKPVNLFHLSTLWLVHPHSTSLTISPAPGCSLILYPTKADNLSKTYLSLLYSISGSSYFFFPWVVVVAVLSPHSEDLLGEVKNYIIQEGKYCLTFAFRGCLIHLMLPSFLTLFPFTLTSSLLFLFNLLSLCNLSFFISISATFLAPTFSFSMLFTIFQTFLDFISFLFCFFFFLVLPVVSQSLPWSISSFCQTYKW